MNMKITEALNSVTMRSYPGNGNIMREMAIIKCTYIICISPGCIICYIIQSTIEKERPMLLYNSAIFPCQSLRNSDLI